MKIAFTVAATLDSWLDVIDIGRHPDLSYVQPEGIDAGRMRSQVSGAQFAPSRTVATFMCGRSLIMDDWLMLGAIRTRLHHLSTARRTAWSPCPLWHVTTASID